MESKGSRLLKRQWQDVKQRVLPRSSGSSSTRVLILPIQHSVGFNSRSRRTRRNVANSEFTVMHKTRGLVQTRAFCLRRSETAAQCDLHYFYGTVKRGWPTRPITPNILEQLETIYESIRPIVSALDLNNFGIKRNKREKKFPSKITKRQKSWWFVKS